MEEKKFWTVETMRMFIAVAMLMASNFGFAYYVTSDLEKRLDKRFDRIDARFDRVEDRLDKIDARLDTFGERIAKNEARLEAPE